MADCLLAVDLGKTRCRVALWDAGGASRAEGGGAPGLASPGGLALAEQAILAVSLPLLRGRRVRQVAVGAAGAIAAPEAAQSLAGRLCRSLPAGSAAVTSDVVTAHAGAFVGAPGAVLAVGTGVVVAWVDRVGGLRWLDGLGFWLGDEGGGAWLGLCGLRSAVRAAERRGPATALEQAAVLRFGSFGRLAERLASEDVPSLAASFAPEIAMAAEAGDRVAAALLDEAAGRLHDALAAACFDGGAVAVCGGLAVLFTRRLLTRAPGTRLVAPLGDALDGARFIATGSDTLYEPWVRRADATTAPDTLATEAVRPGLEDLDERSPADLVQLLLDAERGAQAALARAAPQLGAAAAAITARMQAGGRLFYLGAGTSGRLAVLDATELGPTYGLPPGRVIPLLAGGGAAMIEAAEGAEDDAAAAAAALDAQGCGPQDVVLGIAASGRTPYVVAGLQHARGLGALAVAVVNNPGSPAAAVADIAVEILTGAEIVGGSTRMTAGTTQKIALNTLSTAAMIGLGKTYGAYMVDVRATNDKLRRRALRMVRDITGADEPTASAALASAGGHVKTAVVALLAGIGADAAAARLAAADGRIRLALGAP